MCYIQIPALDVERSAVFYETVFGWNIRGGSDGDVKFDDTVGEVSGTWVTGRVPSAEPGLVVYAWLARQQRKPKRLCFGLGGRPPSHHGPSG
jgi:predicted enzyme related to lactoylglutathione lyase